MKQAPGFKNFSGLFTGVNSFSIIITGFSGKYYLPENPVIIIDITNITIY